MVRNWFIWVIALLFPLAVVAQLTPGPDAYGDEEQRITAGTTVHAETSSDPSVIESAPVSPVHLTPSDPASTALSVASEPEPSTLELAEDTQPLAVDEPSTTDRIAVDAATPTSDTSVEPGNLAASNPLITAVEETDVAPNAPGDGEDGVLSDGVEVPVVQAEVPSARRMALRAAVTTPITSIGTTIGTDHPANPGDVMVFKQAELIEGMVNTWEVTLRIEGMDPTTTADVVLVIDTSGSMGNYGRMQAAKDAANAFIDRLLTDNPNPANSIRIGIVTFASQASAAQGLAGKDSVATLHNTVNGLVANGGTFTQAGMHVAKQMLTGSTADHKHIVLLSDGQPTYSYAINNRDNYLVRYDGPGWETSTQVPESAFNYANRVGDGANLRQRYYDAQGTENDRYYNNGNSAIAEAGFAKAEDTRVWTIALSVNEVGQRVLGNMASPDSYYTSEPTSLTTVFTTIAGAIVAAVNDAEVTDPMGVGFQIPSSQVDNIQASQGPWTYDPATNRLSWNPGTLTTPISPGSNIKYAELIYRIEINDAILGQTPNAAGEYPTNGDAQVGFTDANGNPQTQSFPIPTVNPVLYTVKKVLVDSELDPLVLDRDFTVEVSGPGTVDPIQNTTRSYVLNASHTTTKLITDLRFDATYTFAEIGALGDYKVSYEVNGNPVTDLQFTIAGDQTDDVHVTVTNVYEPITVTGAKTWVGAPDPTPAVWFQLVRVNPDNTTTTIGGPRLVPSGTNQVTWTQLDADVDATKFVKYRPDAQPYEYRVNEVDALGNDYIPVGFTKNESELSVTNTFHEPDPTNITSVRFEKTWRGVPEGTTPPDLTVTVRSGDTVYRTATLVYPATSMEWKDLPLNDDQGHLITYTVEESQLNDYDESPVTHTTDAVHSVVFTDGSPLNSPSFIITRLDDGANQPFVIWTLNHVTDRTGFLNQVIAAAQIGGTTPQIIIDLETYVNSGNTYFLWYEGAQVADDALPADPDAGAVRVAVTFSAGAITTSSISFEGGVWSGFVSGTYSSTLATATNTHNPTGLTLIKAIDAQHLSSLPSGVLPVVDASQFTVQASIDQTVALSGAGQATTTDLTPGSYALSESADPGNAADYYVQKDSWVCADDETDLPVHVADSAVQLNAGQQITCTLTNATAALTVLKHLPNGDPTQIRLTATPGDQTLIGLETTGETLTDGKATVSTANTIPVRPGVAYTLDESASVAFLRNGLERYTGPDPANPDMTNAAHWVSVDSATVSVAPGEHAVYRFVNRTAPAVPIPLTGGVGRTAFLVSSALLVVIATTTVAAAVRRRDTRLAR